MSGLSGELGVIGVLMGGYSSEREISLKSGKAVCEALQSAQYKVKPIDITARDPEEISRTLNDAGIDVAFIALHGELGEDGIIQTILEAAGIPYSGSGPDASRLALDKVAAYKKFEEHGVPVPPHRSFCRTDSVSIKDLSGVFSFPFVVKPACQGSSIGISLVQNENELAGALRAAFEHDNEILIEQFIRGRELTVGILEEKSLPVIEVKPKGTFFDFTAKYQSGTTEYLVPAPIPEAMAATVQALALSAHRALGCENLSRVDVMLDGNNSPYVLEVNTIPGFTATSLLPKAAKVTGLDFTQLVLKIVRMAYEKTCQK